MGRLQIPRHRADKDPEFIPITDLAWDTEQIAEEVASLDDEVKLEHPFFAYHRGQTRYDLDAQADNGKAAREYLKPDVTPEVWTLRRLQVQEWYEVYGMITAGSRNSAALRACRLGVVKVTGYEGPKLKGLERGSQMSADDVETLFKVDPGELVDGGVVMVCGVRWAIGGLESLPVLLGEAVINASAPPTSAEKKAFGS